MACLFWLPSLRDAETPAADQVFHGFWFSAACRGLELSLGSLDGSTGARPDGLFTLSVLASLQQTLSCRLAAWLQLDVLAVYLCGALMILFLTTYVSARQVGFSHQARLLLAFMLATAPCSFSRLGHLDQTVLIAVVPTLMACLRLHRLMCEALGDSVGWQVMGAGLVAALLTFPAQEYYVLFSLLIVVTLALTTWLEISARSLTSSQLRQSAWVGLLFIAGFVVVLALIFLPKFLVATSPGPPSLWMTQRLPTEQLLYGLMPMTWFVPPNLVEPVRMALKEAGFGVHLESYFWSAGSLLIPLALVMAVRRLLVPFRPQALQNDHDRRFFARLLLIVVFLALTVMTIGGLGTLFATFVSPVLRSLNRFTVFVYGASVVYLVSEFDYWLKSRDWFCEQTY